MRERLYVLMYRRKHGHSWALFQSVCWIAQHLSALMKQPFLFVSHHFSFSRFSSLSLQIMVK